jgi:hypothetical protein
MNCLTAREMLDLIRSVAMDRPVEVAVDGIFGTDGNEVQAGTIEEAARHVKSCPACQTAVRRREKIDERIGQLSRELPVPEGLQERLLARLSQESASASSADEPQATLPLAAAKPAVRSRRRIFVSGVAACAALVACVGIWRLVSPRPVPLTVDEIAGYALSDDVNSAAGLPLLTHFKGGLEVQLPKTIRTGALRLLGPFRHLVDPLLGDREIAVSHFTLSDGKRGKFAGVLVVVPVATVKDAPAASSFTTGQTTLYRKGVFCTTAWTEGNFVYLCCVHGDENVLHLLRPAPPASA